MPPFHDRTAVVTGAGSGIGRGLALRLAADGARLALSDQDESGLEKTVAMAAEAGATRIVAEVVDVRDRGALEAHASNVADDLGDASLVVNNAGVAYFGDAADQPRDAAARVMDVNFWGVVNGTEAFLPQLRRRGTTTGQPGRLVNISSLFGLMAFPSHSAYNASKFAVRGYSEALGMELRVARDPVTVTTVHPGGIRTSIARSAQFAPGTDIERLVAIFEQVLTRTTADQAARTILRGAARGRSRVLVGLDAHLLSLAQRALGSAYQGVVTGVARAVLPLATGPVAPEAAPDAEVTR